MKQNFLSLNEIYISRGSKEILSSHSELVDKGSIVAIVGSNGAGKTTLLKAIAGLLQPKSGSIQIDDCSFNNPIEAQYLRTIIGYAKDTPALYAHDTVASYLEFMAKLKKVPKKDIKANIDECLELFELTNIRNQYIHTLSKGMQQRINLAQAILNSPQLLILDEPCNALDAEISAKFCNYLATLKQQGVTVVYASHVYSDLVAISDYMLKIHNLQLDKIFLPTKANKDVKLYDYADYTA